MFREIRPCISSPGTFSFKDFIHLGKEEYFSGDFFLSKLSRDTDERQNLVRMYETVHKTSFTLSLCKELPQI